MFMNVICRSILCGLVCFIFKKIFRWIEKRTKGVLASFFKVLATTMAFMSVAWPVVVFLKSSTTVASETRYLITGVQIEENSRRLNLVVENNEGIEAKVSVRTNEIQERQESNDYLVIQEYELFGKNSIIEYSSQSPFARVFKSYQFQNEIS